MCLSDVGSFPVLSGGSLIFSGSFTCRKLVFKKNRKISYFLDIGKGAIWAGILRVGRFVGIAIHLSIHPLVHLCIYSYICLWVHMSIGMFIHLYVHEYIYWGIRTSIHLHMSVGISAHLCLCVHRAYIHTHQLISSTHAMLYHVLWVS